MNDRVVIIAGGPSLTREDVEHVENSGVDIIGINDAYRICRKLTILYACDRRWWQQHYGKVKDLPCRKISLEDTGYPLDDRVINDGPTGLSLEWPKVKTGRNSGYQAINVAILLGYKRLILLGYDMQLTGNKVHWFGSHPAPLSNSTERRLAAWVKTYNDLPGLLPPGVEIINATRKTALTCFPRMSLDEALSQ